MECKFLQHGLAITYNQVVKPCCIWNETDEWIQNNHVSKVDLTTWHQHALTNEKKQLADGNWPEACKKCEHVEKQGRADSLRGNGNSSYKNYSDNDITLEIRPGNTCNFACQTCWPDASSRVSQYYSQIGLIDIKNVQSFRIDNFDFLNPIKHRLKDVILLGGEPFYDKSCKKFLNWAQNNLNSNLLMFTNGSVVDYDFLKNYPGDITLVFSLDAIGTPAEYIRFGTIWDEVLENYQRVKTLKNVNIRVNITCTVFNYAYLKELIKFLCQDWPSVVSFTTPWEPYFREAVIPFEYRAELINSISQAIDIVKHTNIESGQQANAINALQSFVDNLTNIKWDQTVHQQFKDLVQNLDRVKGIKIEDYCTFTAQMLSH